MTFLSKSSSIMILTSILFTGCSSIGSKQNLEAQPSTIDSYIIGNEKAKHKLVFMSFNQPRMETRKITLYTDSIPFKKEFDLCIKNPEYIKHISKLSQAPIIIKANKKEPFCNSAVEVQKVKGGGLLAKYSLNFYTNKTALHSGEMVDNKFPGTILEEAVVSVDLQNKKTLHTDYSNSYWRLDY